jgi:PEP-CTERM motif
MKNIKKSVVCAALSALAVSMASSALAATITYTLTGTGSATIGNVAQSGAFTATGIGDTANVGFPFGANTPTVPLSSFTIAFGSSVYTATNPIRFFVNNGNGVAGFNDTLTQDVLDFSSSVFLIYNGISNAGPIAGTGTFTSVLATNAGALNWTATPAGILTFRAVVGNTPAVPEPASWAMMIAGFGMAGVALRRRAKVTVSYA